MLQVLLICVFIVKDASSHTPRFLRGLVVRRWICNPEVPGSNPPPSHWMDLSSVAPNSTPPRLVNSQLVCLPPVGILNLLCLICMIFVCYAHLNIFTWNLCDINVYYYYCYYYCYYYWVEFPHQFRSASHTCHALPVNK